MATGNNRNVIFAHPNHADMASLSGGDWRARLPRCNLASRFLGEVARTNGLDPAAMLVDADLGASKTIRVVALLAHNGSATGGARIIASDEDDFSTVKYDSGDTDLWPTVFTPGTVEWEADSFWLGVPEAAIRDAYPALFIHILPEGVVARYWRVEITDDANPDGYFEAGRLILSPGWQPLLNYSIDWRMGIVDPSNASESLGGAKHFELRPSFRVARISLDHMTAQEGWERAFDLTQVLGRVGEVFVVLDPEDARNLQRQSLLARLDPSELRHPRGRKQMSFTLEEVVK
ncbi:MAG: hypothetical protein ABF335_03200 [Alphaproteobacteria bacterium]